MSSGSSQSVTPSVDQTPRALKSAVGAALALSMSWSVGGCATNAEPRNAGERLSDRGHEIVSYGTAWSEGQKSVRKGEAAIDKSNSNLAEGERDLERARNDQARAEQRISDAAATKADALKRIEDGRMQMTQAEADYSSTKAGPSAIHP